MKRWSVRWEKSTAPFPSFLKDSLTVGAARRRVYSSSAASTVHPPLRKPFSTAKFFSLENLASVQLRKHKRKALPANLSKTSWGCFAVACTDGENDQWLIWGPGSSRGLSWDLADSFTRIGNRKHRIGILS
jgi:hypothetical protein